MNTKLGHRETLQPLPARVSCIRGGWSGTASGSEGYAVVTLAPFVSTPADRTNAVDFSMVQGANL